MNILQQRDHGESVPLVNIFYTLVCPNVRIGSLAFFIHIFSPIIVTIRTYIGSPFIILALSCHSILCSFSNLEERITLSGMCVFMCHLMTIFICTNKMNLFISLQVNYI